MEAEPLRQSPESQQELEGFPALDRVQADLDDVARALRRLDEGTYGTCQTCGSTLDDELLTSAPTARLCAECK